MIIRKTINDERWDIEIKSDYKHKSKPIEPLTFYSEMENVRNIIFPEDINNINENIHLHTSIEDGGPFIPEYLMTELTKIFSIYKTYPIEMKLVNEKNVKIKIHVRKDGCMTISRYTPKGVIFPEPKQKPIHDHHWL